VSAQSLDKILIVDDEPEITLALKLFLDDNGYTTSIASSGETALALFESEKDYTAILLDIKMPGIDGVTVLKRIQDSRSDAAVVMMSGHGSEDLAVECMKKGASDYISKPFAFADMLLRIEMALIHRRERMEKQLLQQEKEDFVLMLSHDMKNPLTAVIGSIDIIREECLGKVNEEQKEYLQSAIDSCNEVVTMIDNLLDLRKFELGKFQMAIQQYNAHDLVDKIANQFARPAKHDGIELSVISGSGSGKIAVDRNAFNRVIGNLLGNSLKFTPEGGKIIISCHSISGREAHTLDIPGYIPLPPDFQAQECFVKVSVRDTGNGIPHDELERIFDRYSQFSRKSERERGGAGLGLAYCKLVIERFNGMIWAKSEAEQGSEFTILLPCCSE